MAFLAYGANDPAVIFRHDLKTALAAGDISGKWSSLVLGANGQPTVDPLLGTIAKNGTGNTGYRFNTYVGTSLVTNGFQISIDVQSSWIAAESSAETTPNGSTGYVPSTSQVLISALSAYSGSSQAQALFRKLTTGGYSATFSSVSVDDNFINFQGDGANKGAPKINSWGLGDWVTLNFGVVGNLTTGGIAVIGINGFPIAYVAITYANYANPLNDLYIGCDRFSDEYVYEHYFRNLQITARGPDLGRSNGVALAFLSDSLTDATTGYSHPSAYDNTIIYSIQRTTFQRSGLYIPSISVDENGGYGIGSYLGANVLSSRIATVLAGSPTHLVICAGTNDLGSASYDGADFTADYKTLIETAAGVNGNAKTTVRKIGLCLPPPRLSCTTDATHAANHSDVRARISALPSWFKAAYTDSAVEIVIVDNWTQMGADHALADNTTYPQNTSDGVHLSSLWQLVYARTVYDAMIKVPVAARSSGLTFPLTSSLVSR